MDLSCHSNSTDILNELITRYPQLGMCREQIEQAVSLSCSSYKSGGKLLVCGNGGSAADSEHIVGELMKSFRFKRKIDYDFASKFSELYGEDAPSWLEGALPAIALVSHTALSTAFGNDESSVGTFAQQVYGYGNKGDVFVGITTSGTSENVLHAAKVAKAKDMHVFVLTGEVSTPLTQLADVSICVPETETFKVQELHLPVYHALCAMIEANLFGGTQ